MDSLLGPSWLTVWLFSVTGSQGLVMVALSSSEPGTSAVDVVAEKENLTLTSLVLLLCDLEEVLGTLD